MKDFIAKKVSQKVKKDEIIGILGLSFKPGSDDVRLTPTKDVIEKLLQEGYKKIIAYDPWQMNYFKPNIPKLKSIMLIV